MRAAGEAILAYLGDASAARDVQRMHLAGAGAIASLETKLRRHYGMRHALCVSSATAGLHGLALALGMKGKEFITTPLTYGGTLAGWLHAGARPVFADIDEATLNLDPEAVIRCLGPRVRALLAVDLFGVPSDMRRLRAIADEHGLFYVADAAQSLGATIDGLPASSLADALVVSFTAGKTIFAGEGGAVLTNDQRVYERLVWLTQHPDRQRRDIGLHAHSAFNLNYRMHPLAAIWADAVFAESLEALAAHQSASRHVLETLVAAGLADPRSLPGSGLLPSYFRVTASRLGGTTLAAIRARLAEIPTVLSACDLPMTLVPQEPAFRASWRRHSRTPFRLAGAERQLAVRVSVDVALGDPSRPASTPILSSNSVGVVPKPTRSTPASGWRSPAAQVR